MLSTSRVTWKLFSNSRTRISERARVAIRGGAWTVSGYAAAQVLRTVSTLVLARYLLSPESFGIVGLVMVFLSGCAMFSELGLTVNIVQHPRGDEPQFLNTAYTVQTIRGAAIWIFAALAAYPLALFYDEPQIFPLLVVAGSSEFIRGLASTSASTLTRNVNLRGLTLLNISAEIVAFVACILYAMASPSAWALVVRNVTIAVIYSAGTHFIASPRMRFAWDRSAAQDILRFGAWISIATAAHFLASQGERLILGKLVTAAELGCFSLALVIAAAPAGPILQLVGQIFLPMISASVRATQSEVIRDFGRARIAFLVLGLVAGLGFLACSWPVVSWLLPPSYADTGWMLQLLGLRIAMDLFAAPVSTVVMAYGFSHYSAQANMTRLLFMVPGLWAASLYIGIEAAVLALIVAQGLSYFPLIMGLRKLLPQVAGTELRWYLAFVTILTVATALLWRTA